MHKKDENWCVNANPLYNHANKEVGKHCISTAQPQGECKSKKKTLHTELFVNVLKKL